MTDRTASRFSLAVSGAGPGDAVDGLYDLLLECASLADRHELQALWIPERHFSDFGGGYPNAAVAAAVVAARTTRLHVRGSGVLLALHDPITVAEDWAMVDRFSNGRAGVAFAAGWVRRDFALGTAPFEERQNALEEHLGQFRRLWSGAHLQRPTTNGSVLLALRPRPRGSVPIWLVAIDEEDAFVRAGELGARLLIPVVKSGWDSVEANIARYRRAWRPGGVSESPFVTALVLTYVAREGEDSAAVVAAPLKAFLRSYLSMWLGTLSPESEEDEAIDEGAFSFLADRAANGAIEDWALIGEAREVGRRSERLLALGVDEIACFVDFGLDNRLAVGSVERLVGLAGRFRGKP